MKIATYNIWNVDQDYELRMDLVINTIHDENLDIVALQEVRDESIVNRIAKACGFRHKFWKEYFDCQEGLAILSKYEIEKTWTNWNESTYTHNCGLMYAKCKVDDKYIDILNLHLDYEKASNKEIGIVDAVEYLKGCDGAYQILLGDFNTTENSSVYRYITSRQSLNGHDAYYIDLPASYCYRNNIQPDVTIDFVGNPRWKGKPSLEVPARFDCIFVEESYPRDGIHLTNYKLLGKKLYNGITPSDHYGVMVELTCK